MKKKKLSKRRWIPLIGYSLAAGVLNNFVIAPIVAVFIGKGMLPESAALTLIVTPGMLTSIGILIVISIGRDCVLHRVSKTNNGKPCHCNHKSESGWMRLYLPMFGWFLAVAYFLKCVVFPYLDIQGIEEWNYLAWEPMIGLLSVLLGVSGTGDIIINRVGEIVTEAVEEK